jgi:hypothetical protein
MKVYYHVFCRVLSAAGSDHWCHSFSADTRADAQDEVSSLKRSACKGERVKTLVIRSAHDPLYLVAALNGR